MTVAIVAFYCGGCGINNTYDAELLPQKYYLVENNARTPMQVASIVRNDAGWVPGDYVFVDSPEPGPGAAIVKNQSVTSNGRRLTDDEAWLILATSPKMRNLAVIRWNVDSIGVDIWYRAIVVRTSPLTLAFQTELDAFERLRVRNRTKSVPGRRPMPMWKEDVRRISGQINGMPAFVTEATLGLTVNTLMVISATIPNSLEDLAAPTPKNQIDVFKIPPATIGRLQASFLHPSSEIKAVKSFLWNWSEPLTE